VPGTLCLDTRFPKLWHKQKNIVKAQSTKHQALSTKYQKQPLNKILKNDKN